MEMFGKQITAAIFDFDGTLLDSGDLWHQIDIEFFKRHGKEYPSTYLEDIAHVNLKGAAKITREKYGIDRTDDELIAEWMSMSQDAYAYQIPLKDGAKLILDYCQANNIPMALATAGDKELFMPAVKRLGLEHYFDVMVNVGDIGKSKEHPDIYIEAAKRLGSPIESTAVFEDMPTGLKSSFEAGFVSIAVRDDASAKLDPDKRKYCHGYVNSWPEFVESMKK